MKILAIETSCDETAVSIIKEASPNNINVLGHALYSQIDIHKEYGGVFPALAKREHAKSLVPIMSDALEQAGLMLKNTHEVQTEEAYPELDSILEKDPELLKLFKNFILTYEIPDIDYIAITNGPGLAPALWVGVNFARALSYVWKKPLIPVNHMEGHMVSVLGNKSSFSIPDVAFPTISLLISGGHTELILIEKWGAYTKIGQTLDDATGEAFDKVARMLGLQYPGGPKISKYAQQFRDKKIECAYTLPRPMINTDNLDFSFSGLKTASRYLIEKITHDDPENVTAEIREQISFAFEEAVTEVLLKKTKDALLEHGAETLIIAGGVAASLHIRQAFKTLCDDLGITLLLPDRSLATDNSLMIAMVGYMHIKAGAAHVPYQELVANANLSL